LLEVRRARIRLRPDEPNEDALAVERVLSIELALPIFEFTDLGHDDDAILAVRPVEAPLVRLGVVRAEREALDVTARAIGLELLDLRGAVPQEARHAGSIELDPLVGAGQRMQAALEVDVPVTNLEIEVVLPVGRLRLDTGGQGMNAEGSGRQRAQGNEFSHASHLALC
jgi:hypothetical protein